MKNKVIKLLSLFVLSLGVHGLYAQTTESVWIELNPDLYLFKNKKLSFTPEVGYRINDFHGSQSFFLRPHVGYKISKYISTEVGIWYTVQWDDFTTRKNDLDLYQHISFSTPSWNRFSAGIRIRQEEIFSHKQGKDTEFGTRTRIRPYIKYSLPVWEDKSLYLQALVETHNYWGNHENFDDALWIAGRFGISPTSRLKLVFEYNYSLTYKPGYTTYGNRARVIANYRFL